MKLRTALLTAALISLLAPVAPAGHSSTIKAQAQVGEWVDVSKEINAGLPGWTVLNSRNRPDNGVLGAVETPSDKAIVRGKCAKPGTMLWEIEYTTGPLGQRTPKEDRHYLRVEVTCLEKDTEK